MNKSDNMAQLLVNDMANNIQPNELFEKFSRILDKDLDHNHKRRVFLKGFLTLYRNSVDNKMAFNESRLRYYKTIEKADAELKALREYHGSYDESEQSNEYQLNDIEIQALDNVCQSADRTDKRDILKHYLILSKSKVKKEIRDLFESKYQLKRSTFYQWTKALNDEIKSISRTKK